METDNETTDQLTLTLPDGGIIYPPTSMKDAYYMFYPYLPDRHTPWRLLRSGLVCLAVALGGSVALAVLAWVALWVGVTLGPIPGLFAAGAVGFILWWVCDKILYAMRVKDDLTIKSFTETN